jgi:hypothetical protein
MHQPEAKRKARIRELQAEIDSIHAANKLYWEHPELHNLEAQTEHKRRQDRLEGIRAELAQLRSS